MTSAPGDLAAAWNRFKRHWRVFVLAQLAIVAAWVLLELAVVAVHRAPLPAIVYRGAWLALHLGFLWCFGGIMAGLHAAAARAASGSPPPTLRFAFSRFDRAWTYLLGAVLYWIPVLAGLCLAIVPGVALAVRWGLFRFVLADRSTSALASLREADSLSASNRWPLFRVVAISIALNLAGAALLGVGLLIAFPVTLLMRADYFLALRRSTDPHG